MPKSRRQAIAEYLVYPLAILSLFCVVSFLRNIDSFAKAALHLAWPYWLSAALVAITCGIGLQVPFLLWWKSGKIRLVVLSGIFSVYFLALQLYLAIIPNLSSCNCASASEAILRVKDWSLAEAAFILFLGNAFVLILMLCRKFIKAAETAAA